MGFSVIVLEESLAHARAIDHYVMGGDGDLPKILNSLANWFLWDTHEMHDLIEWMRCYNADPEHERKVRFFGVDICAPRLCMNNAFTYLDRVGSEFASKMRAKDLGLELINDQFWPVTLEHYQALSSEDREALISEYDQLAEQFDKNRKRYLKESSMKEYEWATRQLLSAHAGTRLFTSGSLLKGGLIRDSAMADNLRWIMSFAAPKSRVIFLAHNAHVARSPFTMPERFSEDLFDMVYHLNKAMGDDLITIAASFNQGTFADDGVHLPSSFAPAREGFFDRSLARTGIPRFILDLRAAPKEGPVAEWLKKKRPLRSQDVDMNLAPVEAYDAVYFIESVTRTEKTPLAKEKYRSLNQ